MFLIYRTVMINIREIKYMGKGVKENRGELRKVSKKPRGKDRKDQQKTLILSSPLVGMHGL